MAVSMNGLVEAVSSSATSMWGKGMSMTSRGATRLASRGMSRGQLFAGMVKNEGFWKAYQKGLQGPMIDGAVKGAMIGAGANTAQYLYNNSDRPSLGGAGGAAFRGALGGAALGGVYGAGKTFLGAPAKRVMQSATRGKAMQTANLLRGVSNPAREAAEAEWAGAVNAHFAPRPSTSTLKTRVQQTGDAQVAAARRRNLTRGGHGQGMSGPGSFDLTGGGRPGAGSVRINR